MGNAYRSGEAVHVHCNSSFFVGSGKDSKGFKKLLQKVKMHVFFLLNAVFQSRWNDGGSAAWSAAALEEPRDMHSKQAAAAPDGMPGCCVAEADLCCDVTEIAATDLEDTTNSKGIGDNSATIVLGDNGRSLFAATDFQDAPNSQGIGDHGVATSVQGDTGSTAFSHLHHSTIRGCKHNSSHHPIHACAHSRLDLCGVGSGVGVGLGVCARVSCGVLPGVADDVDACMDDPALDGIRVAPNSLIQSFTKYHDNSCARLTALQNSRVVRGPQGQRGTKRTTTSSLCQVRLSAGKKRSFSQQQSRKLHGEMWASPWTFRDKEIVSGCAFLVACPSCPDHSPGSHGIVSSLPEGVGQASGRVDVS